MASDDEHARTERLGERPPNGSSRAGAGAAAAPPEEPDELPETIRSRLERLVPELVKKTFAAGLGAVFQTEEGIRKIARESLPEVAGYIASSADGAKDKVIDVIARETRDFLSSLNVSEEIAKILTTLSFEIKTEIRFIPNSERFVGAEPEVKASVRLKRDDKERTEKERAEKERIEKERIEKERAEKEREKDREKDRKEEREEPRSRLRFWQRGEGESDDGTNK
jgi:hypothetical protein